MKKLIEELAWSTDNKVVGNAHSVMHTPENVIAVFWYALSNGELIYTTNQEANHYDPEFIPKDIKGKFVKGRVFKFAGKNLVSFYGMGREITKQQVKDMVNTIENKLNISILSVIDYDGNEVETN